MKGKYGFDGIASNYDQIFTNTSLGTSQRGIVFEYLDKIIPERNIRNVLELNCGTGEDAIYLRQKGCQVVATDISLEMLEVAKSKAARLNIHDISFQQLDLRAINQLQKTTKFDLIFSDFGGFNCLDYEEVKSVVKALKVYLSENGIFVLILMPDRCVVEYIYGFIRHNRELRRRRAKSPQKINFNNYEVWTWYYAPNIIEGLFVKNNCKKEYCCPVGFIPSYFSEKLEKPSRMFRILKCINDMAIRATILPRYSDHYLISFSHKTE
jgi:SAM-dependent methyltransferase